MNIIWRFVKSFVRHVSGFAKRNEEEGSSEKGEFMDVKQSGKPFKGVAKEPDKRRK